MEKSFLFSESLQLKAEGETFFVEGVASSSNPDLENDVFSENALNQMAEMINQAFAKGKPLPLGYEHKEILEGHPNLVPLGQLVKGWVEQGKLFVRGSLNSALKVFNEAKEAITRRDLHSLSIEVIPGSVQNTFVNDKPGQIIQSVKHLIGAGITGRPTNPDGYVNFVAKNLDFANIQTEVNEMKDEKVPTKKIEDVKKIEDEKAPEPTPEPAAEPVEPTPEPSKEPESPAAESTEEVLVSKTRFKKMEEMEKKEAEVSEESKLKVMFDKFYKDEVSKTAPAGAPQIDGQKFDSTSMPAEYKAWAESHDSSDLDVMYKAAGNLVTHYEEKGWTFGTTGRSPKKLFYKATRTSFEPNQSWASRKFGMDSVKLKAQIEHDTDRTTTGTEYYLSGPLLNDIFAPSIFTHLNESHTLYGLLRKEDAGGNFGDTYGFRFKYARTGATANYDESATDDPTASVISRKKAHIPFVWYRMVGQVSGQTIEAARGQGGVGDALAVEIRDQTENLIFAVNTDFFDTSTPSDGMTRGGQSLSLRWLVDNADNHTTLYGHTRTGGNFTTLQGNLSAKSGSPLPSKDDLRNMWMTVVNNGASRDDLIYVTGVTQGRKILNLMDDQQRTLNTNPNIGWTGMPMWDGIPIHIDPECETANAGFIYLLDMRHTFMSVQLAPTMEELAKTGDFRKFQIKTYYALVSTAPNHNFLITGFNTS